MSATLRLPENCLILSSVKAIAECSGRGGGGSRGTDHEDEATGITQLLVAWSEGRRDALDRLVPLLYEDLRRLAAGHMRHESPGHSLQPTALVHEAYVRLIDQRQVHWRNRAHFFGV